jgi:hypothetical protein
MLPLALPGRTTGLFVVCLAGMLALSVYRAGGHLMYTLDDPYIHLAVAENLFRGVYGINLEEHSSPSSSAIYPFLLALGLAAGLGSAAALILNIVPMAVAVYVFAACMQAHAFAGEPRGWRGAALALLALAPLNAGALPLTGMEHALHVMVSAIIIAGLIVVAQTGRAPWWLVAAIMVNPLIRFEGLALSGAAALALMYAGAWRAGLVAGAGAVAGVAAFAGFLMWLGLPPLPSSVLMKSALAARATDAAPDSAGLLLSLIGKTNFSYGKGVLIALTVLCAAALFTRDRDERRKRMIVGGAAIIALAGHLAAGDYGWFGRYEVYAVTLGLMALAYVWGPRLRKLAPERAALMVGAALAASSLQYARPVLLTPAASQNIYDQQRQMGRFATDYFPHPVAVNDLGWVAYRNDAFVLDLWGLGSNEVRRLRQANAFDRAAIARAAQERGIVFAMVYDAWFAKGLPDQWRRVAQLRTDAVSAAEPTVAFYLIDPAKAGEMAAALAMFRATLPKGATLEIDAP